MNERYPDGSLSRLYDSASNWEETRLGLSVPIPTPGKVLLDAEKTMSLFRHWRLHRGRPHPL